MKFQCNITVEDKKTTPIKVLLNNLPTSILDIIYIYESMADRNFAI